LTGNSVFRAFLSLVSCSCWRTRNLILGFDKSRNGDPVQECACMLAALWSILLLVLCWTCYKSTSRSVGHHWLLSFVLFNPSMILYMSSINICFSASFSFGYPLRVPHIKGLRFYLFNPFCFKIWSTSLD
jgi:hypothetical protein